MIAETPLKMVMSSITSPVKRDEPEKEKKREKKKRKDRKMIHTDTPKLTDGLPHR